MKLLHVTPLGWLILVLVLLLIISEWTLSGELCGQWCRWNPQQTFVPKESRIYINNNSTYPNSKYWGQGFSQSFMAGVCSPWPTGYNPVFGREVLLEHSHANLFMYVCVCFLAPMTELNSCNRNHMVLKAWNVHHLPLTNTVANPCFIFIIATWGHKSHYLHFTDNEMEAQRVQGISLRFHGD